MYRKNFIVSLLATALLLAGSFAAYAQTTQPVRGRVMLQKADNTTTPVAGALVEAYRTDISKGKVPPAKTDKNGYFSFAGLPLGQTFALVISAPGIKSEIFPNVKPGLEGFTITVFEGDGRQWTEEEVRQALASVSNTTPELTEEQKKEQAELEKKRAEIAAKNEKIKAINAIIEKSLNEGAKALEANDYDTAIARFDEGYNADPEFAGTAPVFLNNKANALRLRAFNSYKKSTTDPANRAALLEDTKRDLLDAIAAVQKTVDILKTATTTDANVQKNYDTNKSKAYWIMVESYRLLLETKADESKTEEAAKALEEYSAVETDAAQKSKMQLQIADAIRKTGNTDLAIPIYKRLYENSPENPDVLAGLGLSLFNSGLVASANGQTQEGKAQMQEGLNYMQRFTEIAPETHPLKVSVKESVEYLKTQENLTPQKTPKPSSTKKRT
jgi:hypothetical protein